MLLPRTFSWAPADSDISTQININNAGIYYCQTTNLAGSSTAVTALDVQSKNNLLDFYSAQINTTNILHFLPSSFPALPGSDISLPSIQVVIL